MKYAIFGDIHGSLDALNAVLDDAAAQGVDRHICTGDIVGYGAQPMECVRMVRTLACPVVLGNHDADACRDQDLPSRSSLARESLRWTRTQLDDDSRTWLQGQPFVVSESGITVVHASLREPRQWFYVTNREEAASCMLFQDDHLCFIGHTHVPGAYRWARGWGTQFCDLPLRAGPEDYHLVNVGSVGQPRDGDWRASYVIYDSTTGEVRLRRVPYDLASAQAKIRAAGLPEALAARLAMGR